MLLALDVRSLNHWTTRKVLPEFVYFLSKQHICWLPIFMTQANHAAGLNLISSAVKWAEGQRSPPSGKMPHLALCRHLASCQPVLLNSDVQCSNTMVPGQNNLAKTRIRILFTQKIQKRKNSHRQNAYQWLPGAGGARAGKYLFNGYGGLFGGKENALELDRGGGPRHHESATGQ